MYDIDSLHVGASHSSLSTVVGLCKEGAVPSVDDRTPHFEGDTTFAELMEADDDASAADYLARSVALSGGIAVASVKRCTTTSIANLNNHLIANRTKMNEVKGGLRDVLAKLTDIQSAADESADRYHY